jgi:hypothetical protein
MRGSKCLSILLSFFLLLAPSLMWSEPEHSSQSVILSTAEYDQILQAMEAAKSALDRSSKTIKQQSTDLTKRSLLCVLLAGVAVTELVVILKK